MAPSFVGAGTTLRTTERRRTFAWDLAKSFGAFSLLPIGAQSWSVVLLGGSNRLILYGAALSHYPSHDHTRGSGPSRTGCPPPGPGGHFAFEASTSLSKVLSFVVLEQSSSGLCNPWGRLGPGFQDISAGVGYEVSTRGSPHLLRRADHGS